MTYFKQVFVQLTGQVMKDVAGLGTGENAGVLEERPLSVASTQTDTQTDTQPDAQTDMRDDRRELSGRLVKALNQEEELKSAHNQRCM